MTALSLAAWAEAPPSLDPDDLSWNQAPVMNVTLYPQATTSGGPGGVPVSLEARLLRGDDRFAVRIAWRDASQDTVDVHATDRFADAVAVQFAPDGETLPYVGMGEPDRPVNLWFWRAGGGAESLSARGFGSLAKAPGSTPEVRGQRTATGWVVVLRGEPEAFAAVAFAVWDGTEDGRAGKKRLSAWQAPGGAPAAWGESQVLGDVARGARLYVEQGCAACHAPGSTLGPDLSHAGGIHRPDYLRRSIREPSAFLVPGYAAIMPVLDLKPADVDDLVAHLVTLR